MDNELIFWLAVSALAVAGWIVARVIARRIDREYISWMRDGRW